MAWWKQLLIFLIIGMAGTTFAQESQDGRWMSARDAYLKGDYSNATALFEQILAETPGIPAAMYNLGNCYLQSGNLGKAVLWYERARKLKPNDPDILHNLSIAAARRSNPVIEIQEFFAMRWIRKVAGLGSVTMWAVLSLALFWWTIGMSAWAVRTGTLTARRRYIIPALILFIFAVWMGAQRSADLRRKDVAIVVPDEITVAIAPDTLSKAVAKIGAGEKVLILDSLNVHYKVRLANYEHGWIVKTGVEKI